MMIKVKNLQTLAKEENLEEKIAKICEENDSVFMALSGSFVRGDQKKKSDIDILIRCVCIHTNLMKQKRKVSADAS